MTPIRTLFAAGLCAGGALLLGGGAVHAAVASSQLSADLQVAQSGEHATANDVTTAAEEDVNDGQIEQVGEEDSTQNDQSGDSQSGAAQQDSSSNDQTSSASDSGCPRTTRSASVTTWWRIRRPVSPADTLRLYE